MEGRGGCRERHRINEGKQGVDPSVSEQECGEQPIGFCLEGRFCHGWLAGWLPLRLAGASACAMLGVFYAMHVLCTLCTLGIGAADLCPLLAGLAPTNRQGYQYSETFWSLSSPIILRGKINIFLN